MEGALTTGEAGTLTITQVSFADVAELVGELDHDLGVRYGFEGDPVHAPADQFDGPGGAMLLATVDGVAAGCVGLRRVQPQIAELKRMYVRPQYRRLGVARALLTACEQAARDLGYTQLWLETGTLQPEALALYLTSGYEPVDPFGQYADGGLSVHLGRPLGPAPKS